MPEISALSLQSAQMPTVAAPLENARIAAESASMAGVATPAPSFDALLALQAQAQAASPASPATLVEAIAILPDGGNSLPDETSANAIQIPAALGQAILLKTGTARMAANRGAIAEMPLQTATSETADETVSGAVARAADFDPERQSAPVPDIALFAAIFAAPERLANAPADEPATPPKAKPELASPATIASDAAARTHAAPSAAATAIPAPAIVAIASTAQIEVISAVPKSAVSRTAPATAQVSVLTAGQVAEAGEAAPALPVAPLVTPISGPISGPVATSAPASVLAVPIATSGASAGEAATETRSAKTIAAGPETSPAATAPQPAEGMMPDTMPDTILADAPVQAGTQPISVTTRSEAKAERIDFATLVDTLNRAREEASPRTLNVAVTNTDFGRISMRFDSSDAGLSVAMSAADPGFVRAVGTSSEAASTNGDTRGQNGQPQGDTGAARQQQGQPSQQQQTGTARGDARPLANSAPELRKDDSGASGSATSGAKTGESGIYA